MKIRFLKPFLYFLGITLIITSLGCNSKIDSILEIIEENYVDTVNSQEFEDRAISSMLEELDPHSTYISKKDFKRTSENMLGSFSGIGVEFNIVADSIVVVSAISGGPSEELGIKSGDRIVTVEKENVANIGIKNEDVIKKLRGKKGTVVKVQIKRKGEGNLLDFAITRDDIPLNSVDAAIMIDNNIGYIKVNRFSATTSEEFYLASENLIKQNMKSLILDLRGNPGGYLGAAVAMCDEFLEENQLIVYTQGRKRPKQEISSSKYGILKEIEVAVLIDAGSASASEIVSGCLQDHDRGHIIGRRSYGKGLVQEEIKLNDGSAIRITTQRYYTPSGRCIQKPYGRDKSEYLLEQYTRTDEKVEDTLKFYTKMGRTVYGGGGITPDIEIKRNPDADYTKVNRIVQKGWTSDFSLKFAENLMALNLYSEKESDKISFLYGYPAEESYLEFQNFVKEKDSKMDFEIGNEEEAYLKNLIKANIGKRIWGNDIFYAIMNHEDPFISKAKSVLLTSKSVELKEKKNLEYEVY